MINGELRVAHDEKDAVPGRNLESLYLQPLAQRVQENHGEVYSHGRNFQLLIDIKSDGPLHLQVGRELVCGGFAEGWG